MARIGLATAVSQGFWTLQHSLFNPATNAQVGARQGKSVAVDGNLAVAGAPSDAATETGLGVVKVYDATSGEWLHTLSNPSPAQDSRFGSSVALSGTRLVVGDATESSEGPGVGVTYVYDLASVTPRVPILTLSSPNPTKGGNFGRAVGISGSMVVVGANDDSGSGQLGRVYVFDLSSPVPAAPVAVLTNPNTAPEVELWRRTSFGSTLAISGSRLIVGAPDDRTMSLGRAYVYDLSTVPPAPPLLLLHPDLADGVRFGRAVAISGSRVLVGAVLSVPETNEINSIGVAYAFDLTGGNPTIPTFRFTPSAPFDESTFGSAVALSGDRAVIGAERMPSALSIGISYVYDLSRTNAATPRWTLRNPQPGIESAFGSVVAIAADKVLAGAPLDRPGGIAYLYHIDGFDPEKPFARLAQPSPSSGGHFGLTVALSGTRAVVGAPHEASVGAAYVYNLASATPDAALELKRPPRLLEVGDYGVSVAMSGTRVAVGDDRRNFYAGIPESVFVYDLAGVKPDEPILALPNPNSEAWTYFGSVIAMSGTRVVVGAMGKEVGAPEAGCAYLFDLAGATPTVPVAQLTNPAPASRDRFGNALAISGMRVVVGCALDDEGAMDSGSAYVFDLGGEPSGQPWLTLTNPAPGIFGYFGKQVAISGSWVAVSAPSAGVVYVYDLAGSVPGRPILTLTEPEPMTHYLSFGAGLSLSDHRLVVGAPSHFDTAIGAGMAYVFDLTHPTPSRPIATLSNPTPRLNDHFGWAVAGDGPTVVAGAFEDDTAAYNRGAAYVFEQGPILRIRPAAAGFATLSWTRAGFAGFVLQYADRPDAGQWMDAPTGGLEPVTVALTNVARFYRLIRR